MKRIDYKDRPRLQRFLSDVFETFTQGFTTKKARAVFRYLPRAAQDQAA